MSRSKSKIISDYKFLHNLINECYKDPNFCVELMAEKLAVSTSYLRDLIEHYFEITPQKLIESYRLTRSLDLLAKDLKEYEIINIIGYSSTRTFRRAFKNRLNLLPVEYKSLQRAANMNSDTFQQMYTRKLWPSKLYRYINYN